MPGRRTGRPPASRPEWSDVRDVLHLRLKDAAAALNPSTIYLRHLLPPERLPSRLAWEEGMAGCTRDRSKHYYVKFVFCL